MDGYSIAIDDPRRDDVRALLEQHLAFARASTPAEYVHALDLQELLDPSITFFSLRLDGKLLGVGAIKELDPQHAEIKSMHTSKDARRQGVERAIVAHLLAVAAERGHRRVSLETGTTDAFEPARRLYADAGFEPCEPFGSYSEIGSSFFMTRLLQISEESNLRRTALASTTAASETSTIYGSILVAQGEDAVYVSEQLGHADASITFRLYGLFDRADRR